MFLFSYVALTGRRTTAANFVALFFFFSFLFFFFLFQLDPEDSTALTLQDFTGFRYFKGSLGPPLGKKEKKKKNSMEN